MDKILVIGGGSWGTAFANYLCQVYTQIKIWIREEDVVRSIREEHENTLFLPGHPLSERLIPVEDLEAEAREADILVFAVPSKFSRSIYQRLKGIADHKPIVNLSKGFEAASLKTLSQLAAEVLGDQVLENWVTISGPSFAKELVLNHPTAVVAVSSNEELLKKIQHDFSSDVLRLYRNADLMGIEVAASMKNVMAIASGLVSGCGFGYNTTASLVTRGSVEISRIGLKLGAKKETFWGLAGIGDLMLTCFGPLSRNFQLGVKIAKGETLEQIEKSTVTIAEGVETTKAITKLSEKLNIEMPITQKVYEILYNGKKPHEALKELMQRSLKEE